MSDDSPAFSPPRDEHDRPDLRGLTFAFYGKFNHWPSYHPGTPRQLTRALGGQVVKEVTPQLDYLVLGDRRETGRAEARKKAQAIARRAHKAAQKSGEPVKTVQILDEAAFRSGVRVDVDGKRFAFIGGFDCSPKGFDDRLLARMTEDAGGITHPAVDERADYLVVGNRRGKGKAAALRKAEALQADGHRLTILSEAGFLELVRIDDDLKQSEDGFGALMAHLNAVVNQKKLQRAMKMLKGGRNQLFVELDDECLVGVVRSQTSVGVYASWLRQDGRYGCCRPDLDPCMGLQGSPCKHLMVLLVGLVRLGGLDAARAKAWIDKAARRPPKMDEELASSTLLRHAGAEAGELDWRPMETVPEDFMMF